LVLTENRSEVKVAGGMVARDVPRVAHRVIE